VGLGINDRPPPAMIGVREEASYVIAGANTRFLAPSLLHLPNEASITIKTASPSP